jgi:hypothetical protein
MTDDCTRAMEIDTVHEVPWLRSENALSFIYSGKCNAQNGKTIDPHP